MGYDMKTDDLLEQECAETNDLDLVKAYEALIAETENIASGLFSDQRYITLWAKALRAVFSDEELQALKEKLLHHQNQLYEFNSSVEELKTFENATKNEVPDLGNEQRESLKEVGDKKEDQPQHEKNKPDVFAKMILIQSQLGQILKGFHCLEQQINYGPNYKQLSEQIAIDLWTKAQKGYVFRCEFDALKEQLYHYELYLIKLRQFRTEATLEAARNGKIYDKNSPDHCEIKKLVRTIEKFHMDLEAKVERLKK